MNILELSCDVADELSLTKPVAMFTGSNEGDTTDQKFRVALKKTIGHLAGRYSWGVLRKRVTQTITPGTDLTLPVDFLRLVPKTIFDTGARRILTPVSPSQYTQMLRYPGLGLWQFYMAGRKMKFTPTYGATISYEYVTSNVGFDAEGAEIASFSNNTDVAIFDDELMRRGMAMAMREMDRMDFAVEAQRFEQLVADRIKMEDGGLIVSHGSSSSQAGWLEPPLPQVNGWSW